MSIKSAAEVEKATPEASSTMTYSFIFALITVNDFYLTILYLTAKNNWTKPFVSYWDKNQLPLISWRIKLQEKQANTF